MKKELELERMWWSFGRDSLRLWGRIGVSFDSRGEREGLKGGGGGEGEGEGGVWCGVVVVVVEGVVEEDGGSVVEDREGFVTTKVERTESVRHRDQQ